MIQYVRLYADEAGESRFEDVTLSAEPKGVGYDSRLMAALSDPIPAVEVLLRSVVKEAASDAPHNTPRRQFIVQLTGESEVETSTGEIRRFGPGSILLLEDTDGKGHTTRGLSGGERLTLVVALPDDPAAWRPATTSEPQSPTPVS
ncbi:hypothetical protein ACWC2T_40985 [Streptomyces sp. NPDC001393]